MEVTNLNEWDAMEPTEEVSVEKMHTLVEELVGLESTYDEAHRISGDAWKAVEDKRYEILKYLSASKQTKFFATGLGTVSKVVKMAVKVPKDTGAKKELFDWLKGKGEDFFYDKVSVHHGTLNSLYNTENEIASEEGRVFSMPGVGEPVANETLRFTKVRK